MRLVARARGRACVRVGPWGWVRDGAGAPPQPADQLGLTAVTDGPAGRRAASRACRRVRRPIGPARQAWPRPGSASTTRPGRAPSWSAAGSAARSVRERRRSLHTSRAASATRHSHVRRVRVAVGRASPRMLSGISRTPSGSVTHGVAEVEEAQAAVDVEDVVLVQVVVVERERQPEGRDLLGPPAYDGQVGAQAVGDVRRQDGAGRPRAARRTARPAAR